MQSFYSIICLITILFIVGCDDFDSPVQGLNNSKSIDSLEEQKKLQELQLQNDTYWKSKLNLNDDKTSVDESIDEDEELEVPESRIAPDENDQGEPKRKYRICGWCEVEIKLNEFYIGKGTKKVHAVGYELVRIHRPVYHEKCAYEKRDALGIR